MSQGEKGANSTKGIFKQASHAAESLRQNINSFADGLVGSKSNGHSNTADTATAHSIGQGSTAHPPLGSTANTSPGLDDSVITHPAKARTRDSPPAPGTLGTSDTSAGSRVGTYNTGLTGGGAATVSQTASGIHPDAERAGHGLTKTVDTVSAKLEESMQQRKEDI